MCIRVFVMLILLITINLVFLMLIFRPKLLLASITCIISYYSGVICISDVVAGNSIHPNKNAAIRDCPHKYSLYIYVKQHWIQDASLSDAFISNSSVVPELLNRIYAFWFKYKLLISHTYFPSSPRSLRYDMKRSCLTLSNAFS